MIKISAKCKENISAKILKNIYSDTKCWSEKKKSKASIFALSYAVKST